MSIRGSLCLFTHIHGFVFLTREEIYFEVIKMLRKLESSGGSIDMWGI